MSKKNNLKDFLTDVAHAIKTKVPDVATPINPQDFSNIVRSISGGGGEEEYNRENTPLGDSDPAAGTFLAGNLPSGYSFISLNNWTFADTDLQNVKDVFNNYANMTLEDIFKTINISTTETVQIDGTDVYPTEYEKLSGRSMFCFVENGKYTLETTSPLSCKVISKSLIDKVYDDYEVNIVCCNIDVQTANLHLSGVHNIDQATGDIRDLDLGVYFLIERKYLPQKIEAGVYQFIDKLDLDGGDAAKADGYFSVGGSSQSSIEFNSNGKTFNNIRMDTATGKMSYYSDDGDVKVYDVESGWADNAYKKIEFTTEKNKFNYFAYKWAITDRNLVKSEDPATQTLESGTYKFTANPTIPSSGFVQDLNFTSLSGVSYNGVIVNSTDSTIDYRGETTSYNAYTDGQGWSKDNDKLVIISESQQVSTSFLTWFNNNTTNGYIIEKGTYVWKTDFAKRDFTIPLDFTSSTLVCSKMRYVASWGELQYQGPSTYITVYASNAWKQTKWKTITVHASQELTYSGYKYLILDGNIVKQ